MRKILIILAFLIARSLTAMEEKQKEPILPSREIMQQYAHLCQESQKNIESEHNRTVKQWVKRTSFMQAIVYGNLRLDIFNRKYIMPHYCAHRPAVAMSLKHGARFFQKLLIKSSYSLTQEISCIRGNLPLRKFGFDEYDTYTVARYRFSNLLSFFKPLNEMDKKAIERDIDQAHQGDLKSFKEFLESLDLFGSPSDVILEHLNNLTQKYYQLLDGICSQNISLIQQASDLPGKLPQINLTEPFIEPYQQMDQEREAEFCILI